MVSGMWLGGGKGEGGQAEQYWTARLRANISPPTLSRTLSLYQDQTEIPGCMWGARVGQISADT